MFKIIDRYIFRELLSPFFIGLALFTLVLLMNAILELARIAIRGNVTLLEVGNILFWSLPHIFALTVPMSVLLAVNVGLGRMSADNEITILHASGIGIWRIARPIAIFSIMTTLATGYIFLRLVPKANQRARDQAWEMAKKQFHQGIKPREFFERYAGYVIYTQEIDEDTAVWKNVMVADMTKRQEPRLIFAREGRMLYSDAEKYVVLELVDGETFATSVAKPESSSMTVFVNQKIFFNLEKFIPHSNLTPTDREMTVSELGKQVKKRKLAGLRWRPFAIEYHKKFALPLACLVFAIIGLALGAKSHSRAKSAGFVVSLAIIMIYYIFITTGERLGDQGDLPPWLAMWAGNIVLGSFGLVMLVLAARERRLRIWERLSGQIVALVRGGLGAVMSLAGREKAPERVGQKTGGSTTIIIRIPRLSPDFPRILDRYVFFRWVRSFGMILLAICLLYMIVDFSRLIDDISENQIPAATVLEYYEYSFPYIVFLVLGPAALVTTLLVFGVMNRENEVMAMTASGISIYRIVMPAVAVAVALCVGSFFVNDRVIPVANREALSRREEILKGPKRSHQFLGSRWMWGEASRKLFNYSYYDPDERLMQGVMVFELARDRFGLRRVVYGHRARFLEGRGWSFEDGWSRRFDRKASSPFHHHGKIIVPYGEGPNYFVAERKAADELTYRELSLYIAQLRTAGFSIRGLKVRLSQKVALPFVPLVMTVIGIPFALRIGRRGSLFSVGIAVGLITLFWAFVAAFGPLGEAGLLPSFLAAWAPNLIFAIAGVYLLLTSRT